MTVVLRKLHLIAGASCLFNFSPAVAQGDSAADEIIVTAQKREQSLMDVGQTLSVLGADALEKQRITKAEDLAIAIPSLTFARSDYNTPIFSLRGIGFNEASLGVYPAVSFYVDEAPLVFPVLASNATFDLRRIEVLKGPQGTLFGQNSTGGAINLIANKPTDTFEAGMSASYGRFNLFEFSGHISGPLSDTLRARIAGQVHLMDAWQKSYTRPDDHNGEEEYYTGRGILEWEPSADFKAIVTVNAWKDKSDPLALALAGTKYTYPEYFVTPRGNPVLTQPIIPTKPRYADWGGPVGPSDDASIQQATPTRLFSDRDLVQGVLRMEYSPTDALLFTSLTSYVDFNQDMGTSRSGSAIQNEDQTRALGKVKSFSQELRLENTGNDAFHWLLGFNYEDSKVSENQLQSAINNTSAINSNILQVAIDLGSKIENWAIFANAEYEVAEGVTFKAGARYTDSKYKFRSCNYDEGDGNIASIFNYLGSLFGSVPFEPIGTGLGECFPTNYDNVPGETYINTLKEDNVSWRVGLDYHASDDVLLYGNVSKGYKQGSFPTSAPASWVGLESVKQESVLAYEVGVKSELMDRRLSVNAAAFLYKYNDKQVRGSIGDPIWGVLPQLRNIPKSEVKGAELEVNASPFDGLRLSGSVVYLDTEITKIDPLEFNVVGVQEDMTGAPLPLTPKWSYKLDGEYSWEMGGVKPFIGATWRWEGKKDANLNGSNVRPIPTDPQYPQNRFVPGYEYPFVIDSYGLLSARAGFGDIDDSWKIFAWCDNCANKYYWLNVTVAQDNISRGVGRPATYGITASYDF